MLVSVANLHYFFFPLSFGVCVLRYSSLAMCFFCIYCCLVTMLCILLLLLWSTILYHTPGVQIQYAVSLDETTLPSCTCFGCGT
ncbi:hypothetical protein IW261DRAFT_1520333 [Armillaria novae-zelandiae]|uniref:Uncharacterized protein n=1 Tax=Armillaria novae-zelandiae TaxID=153914 RepID=A0AA39NKK4_9AGAR|nr:hypothetical protein IW261DRAFT_1520333 [Armillaria novae-zelandiae]